MSNIADFIQSGPETWKDFTRQARAMRSASETRTKSARAPSTVTPIRPERIASTVSGAAGRMEATSKAGWFWPHPEAAASVKRLAIEKIPRFRRACFLSRIPFAAMRFYPNLSVKGSRLGN